MLDGGFKQQGFFFSRQISWNRLGDKSAGIFAARRHTVLTMIMGGGISQEGKCNWLGSLIMIRWHWQNPLYLSVFLLEAETYRSWWPHEKKRCGQQHCNYDYRLFLRVQWFGHSDIFKQTCLVVVFAGGRSSSTQWHTTNTRFFSRNAHVGLHGQKVRQLAPGSRSNSLKMLAKPLGGHNFCYKWILRIGLQLRVKMWKWNLGWWICFHQRRCAARKTVPVNETHLVTEFGRHIVTHVNLCTLRVNIIPCRITSETTMPTEAPKLCATYWQSTTAGRDSSKTLSAGESGYKREQYCKSLWLLYLYLLREDNRDLTAPGSITSCNSVMSHRDTTCRGSDGKH